MVGGVGAQCRGPIKCRFYRGSDPLFHSLDLDKKNPQKKFRWLLGSRDGSGGRTGLAISGGLFLRLP